MIVTLDEVWYQKNPCMLAGEPEGNCYYKIITSHGLIMSCSKTLLLYYILLVVARYIRERRREYLNCLKAVFEVQRSPDILLYSSYDNTLPSCSTKHMQVYFVLQNSFYRQV